MASGWEALTGEEKIVSTNAASLTDGQAVAVLNRNE
jgi:hypothetical protein